MIKKRLSQVLGAIKKGYSVDTFEGGFPVQDTVVTFQKDTISGVLPLTVLSGISTEIEQADLVISELDMPRCLAVVSDVVSGIVTVYGRNWGGRKIEEDFTYPNVDSISGILIGKQPFFDVDRVILPAYTVAGNMVGIGPAPKFGTKRPMLPIPRMFGSGTSLELLGRVSGLDDGGTPDDGLNFWYVNIEADFGDIDWDYSTISAPNAVEEIVEAMSETYDNNKPWIIARLNYFTEIF